MSAPNQWIIRDVPKVTAISITTGKPLFYLTDVKTSGFTESSSTVYATGGSGNARILSFSSDKQVKIDLENAVFDNNAIALMTGNGIITGAAPIQKREVLTVTSNAATLTWTPTSTTGTLIAVYKANADGTQGTELNFTASTVATGQYTHGSAKTLGFFAGDLANGSQVIVYYMTNTDATSQMITISSDKFPQSFKLVLDCVVKSNYDKQDYYIQYTVPTCRVEDNWGIQMAAAGDPSTHKMPIEILKPSGSTTLYTMQIYDNNLLT